MNSGSHSIEIGVPPDDVWKLLVAAGRRDWYYRLAAEGDFEPGAHIYLRAGFEPYRELESHVVVRKVLA